MNQNDSSGILHSLFAFLEDNRFAFLFGSLLLTIGGSEVLAELNIYGGIRILFTLNLLVLLSVGKRKRGFLLAGLVLFFMHLVFWSLSTIPDFKFLAPGEQGSSAALLIIGTIACFQSAFKSGPVDNERIFAAISLYLTIGLIFALFFSLLDGSLPGSFSHPSSIIITPRDSLITHYTYFSFVTLTTLGYGDIVPLSGPARGLAVLEAIIGQIYLALVIARLVSLYGQSDSSRP
jgi:voltage-gated potassium channel Kch